MEYDHADHKASGLCCPGDDISGTIRPGTARLHQPDRPRKADPTFFPGKIVSQLSVAGLLQTSRGARGGVSLAKVPDEISLLDVVEAIDGPILLNECVGDSNACHFGSTCPMKPVWCDAQKELVTRLDNTTFANLSNGNN